MKLIIEGSTEEIKNVLQAISGSEEHKELVNKVSGLSTDVICLASTLSSLENIISSKIRHPRKMCQNHYQNELNSHSFLAR